METYTTDDALTAMGFGKFQALVLAYAGLGWLAEAMEVMLLSFLGPLVRQEWNLSAQDESLLSSFVFAGMLTGALSWGFVSDRYGRRTVLLFSTLLTSALGFLSALSPNYLCLLALRFFVGIGVGGGHEIVVNGSLFLPFSGLLAQSWRLHLHGYDTLYSFNATSCTIGIELEVVVGTERPSMLLLLPFFSITPESPRYLCVQNRMSDATLVLERIANANQSPLPLGVLIYQQEAEADHIIRTSENEHLIPVRKKELVSAMRSKFGGIAAFRKLLSPTLLRSTLLLWFVFYAGSFAYYGIVLLASQLSDANKSCDSGQIFEVHQKDDNLYKDTFITSLAEIPGLILSAVLVDWFGRKASMWSMLFACCAFLAPLVVHQNEFLTTTLLFGARACGTGSTTVLCLYAPEVYPTSVRSTGSGIANAIGKVGGVVCPLVAVGMLRTCHQMEAVLVFELVLCLAGVACILFPLETKGREMD
ncbi:hypothetical protein EJB05_05544 [Eragrostis curvula]|uniref:Major facilitator superfamily (MFS) profile domain-containing protein n=1 Tax=Eragrostis curvula TaxID=38414 RepID=A0A5J9WCX7_9POAL|nr:hypothetical protein EJB05_05544 [Eragrostis curvula]